MKRLRLLFVIAAIALAAGVVRTGFATDTLRREEEPIELPAFSSTESNADWLVVSPDGPYTTIDAALADAHDGDTIEVRGGVYSRLIVDKSVTLLGVDGPVIDGGGDGTVVTLSAPDIVFRGFEVRGSGVEPDQDHAGITLTSARIRVEDNRLRDVLFGVFVAQADDAVIHGNDIGGKAEYDAARRGDAIRIWYSARATVEHNHVHGARDTVMWYSNDSIVRDNIIADGRYGIHLMYCDRVVIERNRVLDNSVGIFIMYSTGTELRQNLIRGQRGPSGYALGFKDAADVEVIDNALIDNRAGIFIDGTPYAQSFARYRDNILAFNDVGVILQPSVRGNDFSGNTFWENVEQVGVQGGGLVAANTWQGNFWSDYDGLDADDDGVGDAPYTSERFFEGLIDREPRLRALIYSPAVQAAEMAASAFPIVKPQPKLTDAAPSVTPLPVPDFAEPEAASPAALSIAAVAMLAIGLACGGLAFAKLGVWPLSSGTQTDAAYAEIRARPRPDPARSGRTITGVQPMKSESGLLVVSGVTKRYGRATALSTISFRVRQGEAIALWGPNGAGKTTLLKAILGLIAFEGEVHVAGCDVRRDGKRARGCIGYVPQEAVFYDWRVQETMEFYARLKKVDLVRIPALLARLGLSEHAHKPVPALSGGLKQRLALAVALLSDPPLLLLDEPTANLDAQARRDYLALLASLRREGKTIAFASHRLEELGAIADRVLMLDQGRLVDTLTPEQLRAKYLSQHNMTLWIPADRREAALAHLAQAGLTAHLNGRGTLVVRVSDAQKTLPLQVLYALNIPVTDFDLERLQTWN